MASTYTTSLKIQEIGNGEQSGIWGTTTNTNWTLIEQAIAGVEFIVMANANYTLTSNNGTLDEARNAVIVATGVNSSTYQVIAPLVPKVYIISNQTSGGYPITIGGTSGSVITVDNGVTTQVYCDGSDFYPAITNSLPITGGILTGPVAGPSATFLAYNETVTTPTIVGNALVLNCAASNIFSIYLNSNITGLGFVNVPISGLAFSMSLFFTADGTQRTITWPASVRFPNGLPPTMTLSSGKVDTIVLTTFNGGTTWFAYVAGQNS